MESISFSAVEGFLSETQAYLELDMARHSLILGIALTLQRDPDTYPCEPYLAMVMKAGESCLVALMTPPHYLLLTGQGPGAVERVVDDLLAREWSVPGVLAPTPLADACASAWRQRTHVQVREGMNQHVYALEGVQPVTHSPGRLRPVDNSDITMIAGWIEDSTNRSHPVGPVSTRTRQPAAEPGMGPCRLLDDHALC